FEFRPCPIDNLGRGALHSLDKIEEDVMPLFDRRLMHGVGCRNGGYDNAVAVKPASLDRFTLDTAYFVDELVSALVHEHRQGRIKIVLFGALEHRLNDHR